MRSFVLFSFAAIGGYFLWRNRFEIQERLESVGIKTPLLKGDLGEVAQSAVSKVRGRISDLGGQAEKNVREA